MKWILKPSDPNTVIRVPEQTTKDYKKPNRWPTRKIPQTWWRKTLAGLNCIERCILISLSFYGTDKPTPYRLAKELKIKWETADKWLKILKEKGFLEGDKAYKYPLSGSWGFIGSTWWEKTLFGLDVYERCLLISARVAGKWKPSQLFFAKELKMNPKTVRKHLKILKKRGLWG